MNESFPAIIEALKLSVAALREAEVECLLGGSLAAWARGGPLPQKDLDLMVRPRDAQAALDVLAGAGMRPEKPPEEWLYKAWHGEVMIDLIFCPSGLELTDGVFARAELISVMAVAVPVMALEDVLTTKLHALNEHALNYSSLLSITRALREQIDWDQLRGRNDGSPYARAFFTLVEGLQIAPAAEAAPAGLAPGGGEAARARVRVIGGAPG